MKNVARRVPRRDFLKAGGAGLAALAARPLWPDPLGSAELPERPEPRNAVVLRSSQMELILDGEDGLPYEYRLLALDARMRGEDFGGKVEATLSRREPWATITATLAAYSVVQTRTHADFRFEVAVEGKPAGGFVLRYKLDGATVYVTLEDIEEREGFELIQVALPRLVTVREEDGHAWLAHGDAGGSLVRLEEATPGHLPPNTFWGNVLASLPVVMVGTDRAVCVQEVTAYMDGTELAVVGEPGRRRASLGTTKTHRVDGSLCCDMNTAPPPGPRNCGNERTPNLLGGQKSLCRLDFVGDLGGNGTVDWLVAAKLVRRRMPAIPTHLYDRKLVYAIHCDEPRWEKPGATFEQCEELIRDVALLTDHAPQIVHLWGWQYRGKDTGYPAVAEVNARIGGYDGLMRLMEAGRKFNCTVTLSDNYDDAYKSSPAWDPAIIARRPDGQLWESRNWTGENSYIVGLAKYMKGPGLDRVDYTCTRYRLRETTHVDVLTYFSIRNDWDPEHPASGIKNLEGRYKILERFAQHGVDVSSEALRYAFIGKVSSYWYAQGPAPCPFGGQPIPLLAMIYRKSAIWGQSGRAQGFLDRLLKMLFYNGCVHFFTKSDMDRREMTDWIYVVMLPWFKVRALDIGGFQRDGDRNVIDLEGNSRIELNWKDNKYFVSVGGSEVARDGSTFCPLDDERLAFYSLKAGDLSAPLPAGWSASHIAAIALDLRKPEELQASVDGGKIKISVPARTPVIVYRDGAKAKQRLLPFC